MTLKPPKLTNDCFALPRGVTWMPVSEALLKLKKSLQIIADVEEILVDEANGRILSKAPKAIRSSPPVSNSAVDGYGFAHSSITPGKQTLKLQKSLEQVLWTVGKPRSIPLGAHGPCHNLHCS